MRISASSPFSTGYLNGRRSPAPDSSLTCTITGLTLGTSPAEIYYALAESAAFGAKAAIDHLINNGVFIERLVAIGGIAFKSPFIMQLMADANMKRSKCLTASSPVLWERRSTPLLSQVCTRMFRLPKSIVPTIGAHLFPIS